MQAGRFQDVDARGTDALGEMVGALRPLREIGGLGHLLQALGHHVEVTPGEAAVGGEPLGGDQEEFALLGELRVVQPDEATDVDDAVLLGAHHTAVGQTKRFLRDLPGVWLRYASSCRVTSQAFSANRAASRISGTEWRRHSSDARRRFSMETG